MPLFIGLMSGTSADGIDAVLVDLSGNRINQLVGQSFTPMPANVHEAITALYHAGENEIERLGKLDTLLGQMFAEATLNLLSQCNVLPSEIHAIGSHGQTVRHRPRNKYPFTLQIADPNIIASVTQITTVADFRRRDVALGGQGAPLAPAFHHAIFSTPKKNRGVLNIGGIANITVLHGNNLTVGYDTGTGNGLMDYWVQKHLNQPFDGDGAWAQSGQPNADLLSQLLNHPYYQLPPPRSTGREEFSAPWLEQQLLTHQHLPAEDVQATLLELTACSIVNELNKWELDEVYICGGGSHNRFLLSRLTESLPQLTIATTDAIGVAADHVEATAFAWLAQQTLNREAGNNPAVTGATKPSVLGGVYWP